MKNTSKQTTDRNTDRNATQAYSEHAKALMVMAARIESCDWGIDCRNAHWGNVSELGHARELMVQAMVALGAMTREEAKTKHGVTL